MGPFSASSIEVAGFRPVGPCPALPPHFPLLGPFHSFSSVFRSQKSFWRKPGGSGRKGPGEKRKAKREGAALLTCLAACSKGKVIKISRMTELNITVYS